MSIRLLKFSGGSVDDYALSIFLSGDETELPIARTKRGDERRHVSIPLQATEAFHGFEHISRDPPQHHLCAAPALHVALA